MTYKGKQLNQQEWLNFVRLWEANLHSLGFVLRWSLFSDPGPQFDSVNLKNINKNYPFWNWTL